MRSYFGLLAAVALLGVVVGESRADIPGPWWAPRRERPVRPLPGPPLPQATRVLVQVSDRAGGTRLQIPRRLLGTLQAAAPGEGNRDTRHGLASLPFWALALTLGAGLGCWSILVIRTRGPAAGVGLALLLGAVLLEWPETASAHPQPMPPPNVGISGRVTVEIVEDGDAIKLVLDKNQTWPLRYEP